MLVLGLVAAAAVVALSILLARRTWLGRQRFEGQVCVTEDEARKNAAPLTTAIVSRSHDHDVNELAHPAPSGNP
ncbi:MAG TPA: hypothetical protein VEF89_30490 [Solirubrobacteraceae bacterium]|nr:hypothetical protein [Solirubrobacteraceae bacterium]